MVVLGGGMAALSAVYDLTAPANPRRDEFQITVYQLGWRLGGKGASGRNLDPAFGGRIEEHGLHNLFGFYDNTFRLLRGCYDELARPRSHPLAGWRDAVAPESSAVFLEPVNGEHVPWRVYNPANDHEPGTGGALLPLWDTVVLALEFIDLNWASSVRARTPPLPGDGAPHPRAALLPVAALVYAAARALLGLRQASRVVAERVPFGMMLRTGAVRVGELALATALRRARALVWRAAAPGVVAGRDHDARRRWIGFNFGTSIMIGLLEDGALRRGLDSINEHDFRAWLTPRVHDDGGRTLDSVLMRVMYDSSFAYEDGDTRIPPGARYAPGANYEAGTLLRGLLRASFTYKGAFGWKLNGGTGDVLFAPLYELLRRRGVEFRFFHQVTALRASPGPAGRCVDAVEIARQATPRGRYEPLVEVEGVGCWPSQPRYEQLLEGDALQRQRVDLEDPRAPWEPPARFTLRRGDDFDAVILGISLGALPGICSELIDQSPRWRAMIKHVKTTRTQAAQLWIDRPVRDAGARDGEARGQPITGFWYSEASPLNVWADMSHLLAHEPWRGPSRPRHVSYFVSPMVDPPVFEGAERARATVRSDLETLVAEHGAATVYRGLDESAFPWRALVDGRDEAGEGAARLDAQYVRANTAPSERYVLSVAGSSRYRLPAHSPEEFTNLYLAGDWTRNGLNCGAMESAVLSGRLAAHALSGYPSRAEIIGLELCEA